MKKTQSKRKLLSVPTQPFEPVGATSPAEVLERMQQTAFQGKNLGVAFDVWKKMLADYEAPPIDPGVDEALLDFIARRKASMPDSEV